jgi:signal transduction histidine kinase
MILRRVNVGIEVLKVWEWLFHRIQPLPLSQEYRRWRRQFLLERLRLSIWIAIVLQILFFLVYTIMMVPLLNASGNPKIVTSPSVFWEQGFLMLISVVLLGSNLLLLRLPKVRRSPSGLIVMLPLTILIIPRLLTLFYSSNLENFLDPVGFTIVFLIQALLLPVHWQIHALSQLFCLFYTIVVISISIFKGAVFPDMDSQSMVAVYIVVVTLQIVVAIVSNLAICLHEQSLIREFSLRQQLQLFLHAVSHDLRTPIMGSIMLLEQLQTSSYHPFKKSSRPIILSETMLQQMLAGGNRQLKLINSLLEAHTMNDCMPIQRHTVHLNLLVPEILQDMKLLLGKKQATIVTNFPPNLPILQADPLQLRRVYENLLSNALQYNAPGLQIELTAQQVGQQIRCTVRDNGRGMTQGQCDRLFDRYNRPFNTRHPLHLGLGLYICRQIIEAHRGQIGVESQVGEGTNFWFSLPLMATAD